MYLLALQDLACNKNTCIYLLLYIRKQNKILDIQSHLENLLFISAFYCYSQPITKSVDICEITKSIIAASYNYFFICSKYGTMRFRINHDQVSLTLINPSNDE